MHRLPDVQAVSDQAVARTLARKEAPTARLGETPVTQLDDTGWAAQVRAGAYVQLFSELATLLAAPRSRT